MKITNKRELASSEERMLALDAFEAAIAAVDPRRLVEQSILVQGGVLEVCGKRFDLDGFGNVYVVGAGKATAGMAEALEDLLPVKAGAVIVPEGVSCKTKRVSVIHGTHPFASQRNVDGTRQILKLAEKAGERDLVFCLISGGGSALLCAPKKITLAEKQGVARKLMLDGADISELNCVRKHLSLVKGGRLAEALYPSAVVSLMVSDVVGDPLDVIASGPTAPDKSTRDAALMVLAKYGLRESKAYRAVSEGGENPAKGSKVFANVHNFVIGSNDVALDAALEYLALNGIKAKKIAGITGEARAVGKRLARLEGSFVAGGETTVVVKGKGRGGRNQELALSFALAGGKGVLVAAGTDGIDGNSPAAGAIVGEDVLGKAKEKKLDAKRYLDANDSFSFFNSLGCTILTGPTGTNVNDVIIRVMV